MSVDWELMELGDALDLFDSIRVPLNSRERKSRQGSFPYYGAQGVIDHINDYLFDGRYLLIAEDGENLNSRKAPIAFFADGKFWVNNHAHIVKGKKGVVDDYFVMGFLNSSNISGYVTGAAQPKLSQTNLKKINIPLPPLPTQRKIAGVLSAYDDLIENNTRRIAILEEMAQRIYKEWFVDFNYPGHENDKLVESELGMIPEGWVQNYAKLVDFKEGPGLRNWQYREEGIPFLNIRTLINNDIDFSKVKYLDPKEVEERYQHFLLEPDDHVVSSSGTLGRLVTIQNHHLPLMLNTSIIRMRPKTDKVGKWQLKHFLFSDYFQHQINAQATGSAQSNYGPSHLNIMWIISPSESIGLKYEELVSPLEEEIKLLVKKNSTLRQTRDLLLPKLISGKVDVSELNIDIGADA